MTDERIEELVSRYLELHEQGAAPSPEAFAMEYAGSADELARAIHSSLDVLGMLSADAAALPKEIGPYRVVRELGRGGMGVVFEVEREGARHALKLLPHAALHGPKALERFRREAAVLGRLGHDHIVSVTDTGSSDGSPYLVMELVEGKPLSACIAQLELRQAVELARLLALAVQSAHEEGVLHRDLKPQNVLVRPGGSPVLLDFGLGAARDEPSLTSTGDLLGTPRYMAPEQARGESADERTDVYGLGLVLYELVSGRPAHTQTSRAQVLRSVVAGRIPHPRRVRPELPVALERIVLQALAHRPERRYRSAGELARDLQRFLDGASPRARPPGLLLRSADRIGDHPQRSAGVALLLVLALGAGWLAVSAAGTADDRARVDVERMLDRAAWAWARGDEPLARRKAGEAAGMDVENADARDLLAHLDGRAALHEPLSAGLTALASGDGEAAVRLLARARDARPRSVLATLALARAFTLDERPDEVLATLERAALELTESPAIAAELAAAYAERGRAAAAVAECRRGLSLVADDPSLGRSFVGVWLGVEVSREAVEAAHHAAGEGSRPTALSRILGHAADRGALRAVLTEMLSDDPERVDTRFARAVSLDTDHAVVEAASEYAQVLARDPAHAFAMVYLAHLRAGADRERCQECARAFTNAPDLVDVAEAGRLLAEAAAVDRGRDENLLTSIVEIAKDRGLTAQVAGALEPALAEAEHTARFVTIESALRSLRQAERD